MFQDHFLSLHHADFVCKFLTSVLTFNRIKVCGSLPSVKVHVSDEKLLQVIKVWLIFLNKVHSKQQVLKVTAALCATKRREDR